MKLDQREFSGVDQKMTAAQNDYLIGHLRAAGALTVLAGLKTTQLTESSVEEARLDLVTRIFLSGRKSFILAGLLTEVGKKWSRLDADRNAASFDQITDPVDLELMTAAIVRAVIDFFEYAKGLPSDAVPSAESAAPETSMTSPN